MAGRRLYPYELKPPPNWEERVQRMQETPLYLVNTTGPTCYSVRGEDSKKTYKIYIGDRQLCSCGGGKDWKDPQLCIHLLYVMIKVLRAPSTDPLSWQLSLLDAEVTQILQGRFKGRAPQEAKHTFLKKRGMRGAGEGGGEGAGPSEDNGVERHELDDDEVCPICQEGMSVAQALTYCRRSCGNNMHVKCMKMYAEFQRSATGTKVACPLCRVDWGGPVTVDPFPSHDHTEAGEGGLAGGPAHPPQCRSVPIAKFRSTCGSCQGPIGPPVPPAAGPHTTFYRCLLCPCPSSKSSTTSTTPDLCPSCFLRRAPLPNPHPSTPHTFVMAQLGPSSITWLPPAPPPQQAQPTASLPTHLIASLHSRELGDGDYDLLLQLDAPNRRATSLPHYLLSLLSHPQGPPLQPGVGQGPQPQDLPQDPDAEQAEGGQERPEQEGAQAVPAPPSGDEVPSGPPSCGICTLPLSSTSTSATSLRCLPACGHVVHESCVLSALLEASALGAEALAALGCPTCRHPLFAALTLRAGRRRKKAAAAEATKADGAGHLHRRRTPGLVPPPLNAEALAGMFIGGRELLPSLAQAQHPHHPAAGPHPAAAHRTSQSAPQLRPLNGDLSMEEEGRPGRLEVGTAGARANGRQRSGRPPQRASSEGGRPRPRLRPRPLAAPSLSSPPFPGAPMQLQPLCNGLLHGVASPGRGGPLILTPAAAALAEQQGVMPSPRSLRRRQQQSDEDDLFPHSTPLRLPTLAHNRTPPAFVGDAGEALPLLAVGDLAASPSASTGGPFALDDPTLVLEHPPPHMPSGPPPLDESPSTFLPAASVPTQTPQPIRRLRPRHSEAPQSGRPIGAFGGSSSRGGGRENATPVGVRKRPVVPPPPAGLCVTSSLCYAQRPSPSSLSPPLGSGSPITLHPDEWGGSPVGPSTQGFAMRAALRRPSNGEMASSQHQPARDRRQHKPLRRRASLRPLQTTPLAELQIGTVV